MSSSSTACPKSSWQSRLPFFYGWVVVGSSFLSLAISHGVYYTFAVFFVALLEEFGWGRGPTAGVFSVFVLTTSLGGALAGVLTDRFGPSRVVPGGAILLALGLWAASGLSELWQFYLFFGLVCGLGLALAGWVPCVATVGRWFSSKRGLANGIASAGIGLGIVGMVPLSQYLISSLGWRPAYQILALVVLFGVVPQSTILLVARPEDLGLKVDGGAVPISAKPPSGPTRRRIVVVDEKWASYPWTVASAARTSRFWLMVVNFFTTVLNNQMLWAHQVAFLVDGGYDKMLAASVTGLAGFVSMPSKVFWGMLGDRLGRERTFTLGICSALVAVVALVLTRVFPGFWLVLLFAVAFPVGYAVSAPMAPTTAGDLFAGRRFGAIFGTLHIASGIGGAVGAWLAGFVFDVTGSYLAAFGVGAACSITAAITMWLAAPRKVRRVVWEG